MPINFFRLTIIILLFSSCEKKYSTKTIESKRISISDTLESDRKIDTFIAPFRSRIEESMNEVLSYSVAEFSKKDGDLNTAVGNLMADAVFHQTAPIFKDRYNLNLDMVLLNHGGIRAPLPKGPVSMRTPFNMMPFENEVVVAQMRGEVILDMVKYLTTVKRAHPISGMKLHLNKNSEIALLQIQNKNIDPKKTYYVATNDYLYKGGDRMNFFNQSDSLFVMNYKIRNVLIDYFQKQDTLNPKRDNRFIFVD